MPGLATGAVGHTLFYAEGTRAAQFFDLEKSYASVNLPFEPEIGIPIGIPISWPTRRSLKVWKKDPGGGLALATHQWDLQYSRRIHIFFTSPCYFPLAEASSRIDRPKAGKSSS